MKHSKTGYIIKVETPNCKFVYIMRVLCYLTVLEYVSILKHISIENNVLESSELPTLQSKR